MMLSLLFLVLFTASVLFMYYLLTSMEFEFPLSRRSRPQTPHSAGKAEETAAYEASYIFISPETLKSRRQTAAALAAILGLSGFLLGIGAGLIFPFVFAFLGYMFPSFLLKQRIKKREAAFASQILDMLETVSNGLKAGLSFVQSLEGAASQLPSPMGQELQYTLRQNQLGVNLDEALTKMSERMRNDNFNLIISAVTVTRQLGGNLPEIFKIIGETIREREMMEGKVVALTSQGRLQALLMGAMPFLLMTAIFFLDKKTILPLFVNPMGWVLLSVMIVLNLLGFIFIKKIVTIEI